MPVNEDSELAHLDPVPDLAEAVCRRDRAAIARAISMVETDDPRLPALIRAIMFHTGAAHSVGLTGVPGAGKSTLAAALVAELRRAAKTVGVVSVDPSSKETQGAVLGDRVRLAEHFLDPGVYIRSMASRGALGGLSRAVLLAALILDASEHNVVLIETVGAGQNEIDIRDAVDTVVLVVTPDMGDAIQLMKAGILEIPDVVAINKADSAHTRDLVHQLRHIFRDRSNSEPPTVLPVSARTGDGIAELWLSIEAHYQHLASSGDLAQRRADRLVREASSIATRRITRAVMDLLQTDDLCLRILDHVSMRELDPLSAADLLENRVRNLAPLGVVPAALD